MSNDVAPIEDDDISNRVLLINEIKGDNGIIIPKHFENLVEQFLLNSSQPINECNILILLIYGLSLECGFFPYDLDIIPINSIYSFNKKLINLCFNIPVDKLNESLVQIKLKHMLNLNTNILLIIIKMNQNVLITFNPENISGKAIMIIVDDYVQVKEDIIYDNVEKIVKVLKNLTELDIRIKNELLLPVRNIVLNEILNPSLTNIPPEMFLYILKYLSIIDISNLSLVNKLVYSKCFDKLSVEKEKNKRKKRIILIA